MKKISKLFILPLLIFLMVISFNFKANASSFGLNNWLTLGPNEQLIFYVIPGQNENIRFFDENEIDINYTMVYGYYYAFVFELNIIGVEDYEFYTSVYISYNYSEDFEFVIDDVFGGIPISNGVAVFNYYLDSLFYYIIGYDIDINEEFYSLFNGKLFHTIQSSYNNGYDYGYDNGYDYGYENGFEDFDGGIKTTEPIVIPGPIWIAKKLSKNSNIGTTKAFIIPPSKSSKPFS